MASSTLNTLKTLVSQKLGTTNTDFYTNEMRVSAINEAVTDICNAYDVPDLFKVATLSFTSGVATPPTDLFRMAKMWDATNATPEYTFIYPDQFDYQADTSSSWWTIDYNVAAAARRILIKPTTVTSVRIRYVKRPTTLSDGANTTGLDTTWDDAIAAKAAAILCANANDFNKFKTMEVMANEAMARAYGTVSGIGGVQQGSRIQSRFEKYSILENRI